MQRSLKEVVAEVLHGNDIVELLGASMELKPAGGGRFKGLCPFHLEKTPSFFVNREWQTYKCFGCDQHGDAITFLREREGLTFIEALRNLADRAGIQLPSFAAEGGEEEDKRTKALEFLTAAQSYFRETLQDETKGAKGRSYIEGRALSDAVTKKFGVGLAGESWSGLLEHGRTKKVSNETMTASGLVKQSDGGRYYDMFRNRLMFPIRDMAGRILAFGGRDLGGEEQAKYINSPETGVYKKSRVLYGLFEGRDELRRTKRAVVVEGYIDVLRCFEAGIETAVAPCGTALTEEQAALLRRYADEVILLFDGDAAGQRAALKGVGILARAGLSVKALTLPDGADPDDFVRAHGAEAFRSKLEAALDFVTFYVRMNEDKTQSIEGRAAVAKEMFAIFADMEEELRRDEYVKLLASVLSVDPHSCRREFGRFLQDRDRRTQFRADEESHEADESPAVRDHDCQFVAALLTEQGLVERAARTFEDCQAEGDGSVEAIVVVLAADKGVPNAAMFEAAAGKLFASAANTELPSSVDRKALVDEWLLSYRKASLRRLAEDLQRDIEQAQMGQDSPRLLELVTQKIRIEQDIQRVGAA